MRLRRCYDRWGQKFKGSHVNVFHFTIILYFSRRFVRVLLFGAETSEMVCIARGKLCVLLVCRRAFRCVRDYFYNPNHIPIGIVGGGFARAKRVEVDTKIAASVLPNCQFWTAFLLYFQQLYSAATRNVAYSRDFVLHFPGGGIFD